MTLRDFVEMTIEAASGSGWSEYLPTVALPTVREIRVLEGIPDGVDHREALVEYVVRNAWGDRELFFGVRSGPDEITCGHHRPGAAVESMVLRKGTDGVWVTDEPCAWWAC